MSTILFFALFLSAGLHAKEIDSNSVRMPNAPDWLTRNRVEAVTDRIQTALEWTIRKIEVSWYSDQGAFQKEHSLGPLAMAVSRKRDSTIHLGPNVTKANFDTVFGHELVHIILYQKYADAVPKWLEEGLANHLAKHGKVDYAWLGARPFPADVRQLLHPYKSSAEATRYHYMASQALIEMIAKKCDLTNLLRLSVGEKLESYLQTYCEITDINSAFKQWVKKRQGP
jgi:hypothetical protein